MNPEIPGIVTPIPKMKHFLPTLVVPRLGTYRVPTPPVELPPDADVDDWNQAVMVVWVLARKHDNTIPSHWLDAMRSALTVKAEK